MFVFLSHFPKEMREWISRTSPQIHHANNAVTLICFISPSKLCLCSTIIYRENIYIAQWNLFDLKLKRNEIKHIAVMACQNPSSNSS